MTNVSIHDLMQVFSTRIPPCLSIHLPWEVDNGSTGELRLQIERVKNRLFARMSPEEVKDFLDPLLNYNGSFHREKTGIRGMCFFRSKEHFWTVPVSFEPRAIAVLSDSFHIKPIIRRMQFTDDFRYLRIDKNRIVMGRGNSLGMLGTPIRASLNGKYGTRKLRDIAPHLASELKKFQGPTFVFGDIARALADVPEIHAVIGSVANGIYNEDSFEGGDERSFVNRVRQQFDFYRRAQAGNRIAELKNRLENDPVEIDLGRIARFTARERIAELWIAEDRELWGRIDPKTGAIRSIDPRSGHDVDDILDDLAEAVILAGGKVFTAPGTVFPAGVYAVATVRAGMEDPIRGEYADEATLGTVKNN